MTGQSLDTDGVVRRTDKPVASVQGQSPFHHRLEGCPPGAVVFNMHKFLDILQTFAA
jgi:hypothetical protein